MKTRTNTDTHGHKSWASIRCPCPSVFVRVRPCSPGKHALTILFSFALAFAVPTEAQDPDSAPPVFFSGNGRLTLQFDAQGGLVACRWPSPGHPNQLGRANVPASQIEPVELPGAAGWGVLEASAGAPAKIRWLSGSSRGQTWETAQRNGVVQTRGTFGQLSCEITTFAHPQVDLLVSHVRITGAPAPPVLVWYQNFSPCTRLLPEIPLAEETLTGLNDYAAFVGINGRLVQFRPKAPGRGDWERAEDLIHTASSEKDWMRLGEGVWIASTTSARRGAFCGFEDSEQNALFQMSSPSAIAAAVGRVDSAFRVAGVEHEGSFEATVFSGFGSDLQAAKVALNYGEVRGFRSLITETETYRRGGLAASPAPAGTPEHEWSEALLCLAAATSADTGAIVERPFAAPPNTWVVPRTAAWATLAYDWAGRSDAAGASVKFLLEAAKTAWSHLPRGAVPAALLASGQPALPGTLVDVQATAWTLAALQRHSQFLEPPARQQFFNQIEGPAMQAGDVLASWIHGGTGDLLPAFDMELLRDAVTQEHRLAAWMGLESAHRLLQSQSKTAPETWTQRQRELETQLRFQVLHGTAPWNVDPLLFAWIEAAFPEQRRVWGPVREAEEAATAPLPAVTELLDRERAHIPNTTLGAALQCLAATARVYGHL
ncbi:MAG: hypothetical protein HYV26_13660 [Candidatus Hydrogenedentes bacterium]|nr:hypothetical protein [Candidatus Hydrogenedentota bacterium]